MLLVLVLNKIYGFLWSKLHHLSNLRKWHTAHGGPAECGISHLDLIVIKVFKRRTVSKIQKFKSCLPYALCYIRYAIFALLLTLCAMPLPAADAAQVTMAWDKNTEPDIAGYKLYYGTSSRAYDYIRDVGNSTTYTISGLDEGATYYFAVTAYNNSGQESDFSEEFVHNIAVQNRQPNRPTAPSGPSSGYPNTGYDFTTSASDPDGDLLDYRFNWGDGVIATWGATSQSHSWSSTGTYCVKAQARDPSGTNSSWSDCKDINIAVNTYSITASAGAHGNISPSGNVTVNDGASQSFNIIPDQGYYVSDVQVDNASVGATNLYTFKNVTQDQTIRAIFALANQPPRANAGADQSALVNGTVTLDGSGSSDAEGGSLTFKWSFISRPAGSSAAISSTTKVNPTFVVDAPGNYVVQLIVNDGKTNSQPDTVTISTENSPPAAKAGADQTAAAGRYCHIKRCQLI